MNAGGTVIALTSIQCSYTVNFDGSASLDVTFAGPVTFASDFVIIHAAKEFHFIVSDAAGTTVANGVGQEANATGLT